MKQDKTSKYIKVLFIFVAIFFITLQIQKPEYMDLAFSSKTQRMSSTFRGIMLTLTIFFMLKAKNIMEEKQVKTFKQKLKSFGLGTILILVVYVGAALYTETPLISHYLYWPVLMIGVLAGVLFFLEDKYDPLEDPDL